MILQSIIFPKHDQMDTEPLYYCSSLSLQISSQHSARIPQNCSLKFMSYFNAFSSRRWKRFTGLNQCCMTAKVSGKGILRLCFQAKTLAKTILETSVNSEIPVTISFPISLTDQQGFYYLEVQTNQDELLLHHAYFATDTNVKRDIRLAIVSCTFRREEYIQRNVETVWEDILENPSSPLRNHLDYYIIDNGQTLSSSMFHSPHVILIPNANTGGTGGFTRGMMEVLHSSSEKHYTHVLLMDDDIRFNTESLERTYALLCYAKEKYYDAVVGGAMLRNDTPCILEEAGANWTGQLDPKGRGWDLCSNDNLFAYDSIGNVDYQAWWYCCIPLSLISLDNLPLPFFIHCDDTEYGLRNFKTILQLNGICVWHNTFENKRPSNLEYYDIRNQLILNAIYDEKTTLKKQLLGMFKRSTALILRMRYNDVLMNIRGIEDFLKGPEWWSQQNIAELHGEIMKSGYSYDPIPDGIPRCDNEITSIPWNLKEKLLCFLTVNGAFFPKEKQPILVPCGTNPFALYRKQQAYLWDPATDKAIHVTFSMKRLLCMYRKLVFAYIKLICRYDQTKMTYKRDAMKLGTEQYWQRYFS